ncbi:MAG: glycosyltransferase [Paludibacter sp.]|nr:glycosyltransferase [Paludibacter sp.]
MKVLYINAVSGIRSTGRTYTEIADYLNNNGHEGYIAYSAGIPYSKGYKIGTRLDTILHGFFSRIFGLQAYFSKSATKKLIHYLSELKPDVIHLGNLHGNFINLEILLTYLAENDIPTVITLHDCWFYTGKCTHYTVDDCFKWQIACGTCPRLNKDNPSWFFDRTQEMLRDKKDWFARIPRLAVVGVSDWVTNEARHSFLSSAKIVTRIYNWIDLEMFKPVDGSVIRKELGITDKFVILGVASGWNNAKGLNKFIEVSGIIPPEMQIVLLGNISSNIKLPDNIIHIRETHNVSELVEYYSLADVYLHLSKEDTFGKTIAEALSCGTPAIVLNSTACPEIVGDECGIIINEYQTSAVLNAVLTIREKGKIFYSADAINRVKQKFNATSNIDEITTLYEQMINYVD